MILRGNNNIQVVYYYELVLLKEFLLPFQTKPAIPWRPDIWILRPIHPVLSVLPLAGGVEGIGIMDESLSRGQRSQWHET